MGDSGFVVKRTITLTETEMKVQPTWTPPRHPSLIDRELRKNAGPHEQHAGRAAKRARVNRAVNKEVRAELRQYGF